MRSLAQLAHDRGALLKVILETALLSQEEKILACALAAEAGVDFVKTSTGFAASGATAADVVLMRGVVGLKIGVKAAGGIRTAAQFMDMVDAGANRIGASASVADRAGNGRSFGRMIDDNRAVIAFVPLTPLDAAQVCERHSEVAWRV